jgi:hypothetical protein
MNITTVSNGNRNGNGINVMAGLVPAIGSAIGVATDGRDWPGHDVETSDLWDV